MKMVRKNKKQAQRCDGSHTPEVPQLRRVTNEKRKLWRNRIVCFSFVPIITTVEIILAATPTDLERYSPRDRLIVSIRACLTATHCNCHIRHTYTIKDYSGRQTGVSKSPSEPRFLDVV